MPVRPITDVLMEIRNGKAVIQASQLLAEVVQAVDLTGKKGKVTLDITIEPEKGGGAAKTITVECKAKKPMQAVQPAIFFSTDDGELVREDPRQAEMFSESTKVLQGRS